MSKINHRKTPNNIKLLFEKDKAKRRRRWDTGNVKWKSDKKNSHPTPPPPSRADMFFVIWDEGEDRIDSKMYLVGHKRIAFCCYHLVVDSLSHTIASPWLPLLVTAVFFKLYGKTWIDGNSQKQKRREEALSCVTKTESCVKILLYFFLFFYQPCAAVPSGRLENANEMHNRCWNWIIKKLKLQFFQRLLLVGGLTVQLNRACKGFPLHISKIFRRGDFGP